MYSLLILEDRRFLQRQFFCSSLVRRGIIVFIIAVSYRERVGAGLFVDSLSSEVMMRYWTVFNALRASGSMMSISSFGKKVCVVQWDKVVGI